MVSLISSLTEEDPSKHSVSGVSINGGSNNNVIIDIKPDIKQPIVNRIQVSDDDESDTECSSDSGTDSEYSTTSSENNENECEILSEIEELNDILDLEDEEDINLHIISSVNLEESCVIEEQVQEQAPSQDIEQSQAQEEEAITDDIDTATTKSIHLEQHTDFSIFKSINVVDIVATEPDDATNYKKMSLTKLRETAQSLGHGDTSKLKKQELLKLLGAE